MKWFTAEEYRCKCGRAACPAPKELHPDLAGRLDELRERLNRPMVLTSGIRCAYWNAAVGGEPDSRHLAGRAVDIACADNAERRALVATILLWPSEYMPCVEIAPKHVHVDLDYRVPDWPWLILGSG
jgi:hypothetical protein